MESCDSGTDKPGLVMDWATCFCFWLFFPSIRGDVCSSLHGLSGGSAGWPGVAAYIWSQNSSCWADAPIVTWTCLRWAELGSTLSVTQSPQRLHCYSENEHINGCAARICPVSYFNSLLRKQVLSESQVAAYQSIS